MLIFIIFVVSSLNLFGESISKGSTSGYVFGDYYYNVMRDSAIANIPEVANGGAQDENSFQIRRLYFTYDFSPSEDFAIRVRFAHETNTFTSDKKFGVFIKDAYFTWKNIFDGSDFTFGVQPTPTWEISEAIWDNRFLERTIMDLRKLSTSRDLSVSLKGRIDPEGVFNYWFSIGNGSGNKIESDKYKRFYGLLYIIPSKHWTLSIYGDFKPQKKSIVLNGNNREPRNDEWLWSVFLGKKVKNSHLFGIEAFYGWTRNGYISDDKLTEKKRLGISLFGSYYFSPKFAIVCRYDYYEPNIDKSSNYDSRNWGLLAFNFKPDEHITISPNLIIETYQKLPNNRTPTPSITPRITFFYIYK
ncbi:MAG: hypothetical protein ACUVQ1_08645 [Candidatus Kapaibacteriales bacterium]